MEAQVHPRRATDACRYTYNLEDVSCIFTTVVVSQHACFRTYRARIDFVRRWWRRQRRRLVLFVMLGRDSR